MQLQFIKLPLTGCILRLFSIHHLFLKARRAAKRPHWTGVTQHSKGKKKSLKESYILFLGHGK